MLIVYYPDLPESRRCPPAADAISPDTLDRLGKDLIENLSQVYWGWLRRNCGRARLRRVIIYLERIVQTCPGTRDAAPAQAS